MPTGTSCCSCNDTGMHTQQLGRPTVCRKRQLMSYTICMWRGSSFSIRLTGHFSSASGSTVWLVNANTCTATQINTVPVQSAQPYLSMGSDRRAPASSAFACTCQWVQHSPSSSTQQSALQKVYTHLRFHPQTHEEQGQQQPGQPPDVISYSSTAAQ
eukprot:GHRQ01033028.1.p1 GENE.GHRQ01033028.1~~GHRQ01033028.1.p1  ORF type:complete len:157 (+),score=37.13 GHRQ01033028.1:188-658(+)